jgi:hypothetical protein
MDAATTSASIVLKNGVNERTLAHFVRSDSTKLNVFTRRPRAKELAARRRGRIPKRSRIAISEQI